MGKDLRRFLFQTVLGSGAVAGLPPLAAKRGIESRLPLPVLAMRRGRFEAAADWGGWALGVPGAAGLLSPGFEAVAPGPAFEARNVLLTDTALNVAGFLTVDDVRAWSLSSPDWDASPLDASVSDPSLTLTSAEVVCSSTFVMRLFSISSAARPPFSVDSALGSTFWVAASLVGTYICARLVSKES